jgi:transposase
MKEVFSVVLQEIDGTFYLRYSFNKGELDRLTATRLGRTLLLTNRTRWLATEIITCYHDLAHIEDAFKNMKNRDYLRWQPAFHWTDQKIKVHTLCCVLALLLATLARKVAWESGHEMSLPVFLKEVSSMKEIALIYQPQKGKSKTQFTMNKMSPRQMMLAELFRIEEIVAVR